MSFSSREFRDAMGRYATGVCIVTARQDGQKPFGLTVNSFASVSLEPPLILWSLQKDSDCYSAFLSVEQFGVCVLDLSQEVLSNHYARKGDHSLLEGSYRFGKTGCAILRHGIASFECKLEARHDAGDHVILIGRVLEMHNNPGGKPLVFYQGLYRELK